MKFIWSIFKFGFRCIEFLGHAFFALLLVMLVTAGWFYFSHSPMVNLINEKTTLVLKLQGILVEQNVHGSLGFAERYVKQQSDTVLHDVVQALDLAANDSNIHNALLITDDLQASALPPALREITDALERFKSKGKKVVAWGESFHQMHYFLAAHANEIYMEPLGMVYIDGFGGYRNYYRDALDKLGVRANVMRVGKFKSFGEIYSNNEPSKESIEEDQALYQSIWKNYTNSVEQARKLKANSLQAMIDGLPESLEALGGDLAKLAIQEKLLDGLKTSDQLRSYMIENGVKDDNTFQQVDYISYLQSQAPKWNEDAVGVIVAEGGIEDGESLNGGVGGATLSRLIRQAREDSHIKALVLRVNSPGGSVTASEQIRRELEITKLAGKPVVASMGNVAASGGYWISQAATQVVADPATITGSIGVVTLLPTAEEAMNKLSLHTAGVTTTWLAGAYDPRRALNPRFERLIQTNLDYTYQQFLKKVASARNTTTEKIDSVAQGRVWSGDQALQHGLIDKLGSFRDAVDLAAKAANMGAEPNLQFIEPQRNTIEKFASLLGASVVEPLFGKQLQVWSATPVVVRDLHQQLNWLQQVSHKPMQVLAHCFCDEINSAGPSRQ